MKNTFLLIILICFKSYSQDLAFNNFKLENGTLIWQKVYKTKLSNDELIKSFKISGIIKNFDAFDNFIIGNIKLMSIDYKSFGKSYLSTVTYISDNYFNSFILIEFKEGRYKVTLKDMKLITKYSNKQNNEFDISDFKMIFKKSPSEIFNFTFDKVFTIKKKKKSNW